MITAPDGTTATFDRALTRAMYDEIDETADCACANCRNYRAAWTMDLMEPSLVAACESIGIDPKKSLEMSYLGAGSTPETLLYSGTYRFVGSLSPHDEVRTQYYPWVFTANLNGAARIAESGLVGIDFFVDVPWVLTDAEP